MSHELRTPLNSVLGFTEIMLEGINGPLTEAMETDLGVIHKNGQHLLNLINDVLDMAKIEAGRMNLSPEYFHLYEVLSEIVDITDPMAQDKSIYVKLVADANDDLFLEAERVRMRQVLLNLVNNAIKFTDQGQVALIERREEERRGELVLRFTVRDSGIGISEEKLPRLFEAFTQADSSTTRRYGGTGLGLSICKRLVEKMGGKIWMDSVVGAGTAIHFTVQLEGWRQEKCAIGT